MKNDHFYTPQEDKNKNYYDNKNLILLFDRIGSAVSYWIEKPSHRADHMIEQETKRTIIEEINNTSKDLEYIAGGMPHQDKNYDTCLKNNNVEKTSDSVINVPNSEITGGTGPGGTGPSGTIIEDNNGGTTGDGGTTGGIDPSGGTTGGGSEGSGRLCGTATA